LWAKFQILTVLGLYSHIFAAIKVKFGTAERTYGQISNFTFILAKGGWRFSLVVVTLRWAQLVPKWVTAFGRVNYLGV